MSIAPESNASTDLIWLLTRNWHSKIHPQRQGKTISAEHGNLLNVHSFKYSGYSQKKPVTIRPAKNGSGVFIATKRSKSTSPHTVGSSADKRTLRSGSGPRRTTKIVESAVSKYRPSLTKTAAARASAILNSQRKHKEQKARKPRGRKSVAHTEVAAAAEE